MDELQELLAFGKLTDDEELALLQAIIDRERVRQGITPGVPLQMTIPTFANIEASQ